MHGDCRQNQVYRSSVNLKKIMLDYHLQKKRAYIAARLIAVGIYNVGWEPETDCVIQRALKNGNICNESRGNALAFKKTIYFYYHAMNN